MSAELQRKLERLAPEPSREPDIAEAWKKGRRQRQARRGGTAVFGLALIAAAWALVSPTDGERNSLPPIDDEGALLQLVVADEQGLYVIGPTRNDRDRIDGEEGSRSGTELDPSWAAQDEIVYSLLEGSDDAGPNIDVYSMPTSSRAGVQIEVEEDGRATLMVGSRLTDLPGQEVSPAMSPDRRSLAYVLLRPRGSEIIGNEGDIMVRNRDSGQDSTVAGSRMPESSPDWSPDGTQIVYRRGGDDGRDGLYVATLEGGDWSTRSLPTGHGGREPAWSPDGKHIAFVRQAGLTSDVFLLQLDTGRVIQVTKGRYAAEPSWSDDGRAIAFSEQVGQRDHSRGTNVMLVPAAGGSVEELAGPFHSFTGFDIRGSYGSRESSPSATPMEPVADYEEALDVGVVYKPQPILPGGEGWNVAYTEMPIPRGSSTRPLAWVSTEPLQNNPHADSYPARSLRAIGESGILISAELASESPGPSGDVKPDIATARVEHSYHGRVADQIWYAVDAVVDGYPIEVNVYFGSEPDDTELDAAQLILDGLHLRPSLKELTYNGSVLPGPPPEVHPFLGGTIGLPPGWDVTDTGVANFAVANYPYDPGARPCSGGGLLGAMTSDGVAVVAYRNPGIDAAPRPQHFTLDPRTYANYESWGCHPAYRIDLDEVTGPMSLLVFFRDQDPGPQSVALVLRTLDSLRFGSN